METLKMIKEILKNNQKIFIEDGGYKAIFMDGTLFIIDDFGDEEPFIINNDTLSMKWEEVKEPISFMEVLEVIDNSEGDILLAVKSDLYGIEIKNDTLDTILAELANRYVDTGVANILLNGEWFIED